MHTPADLDALTTASHRHRAHRAGRPKDARDRSARRRSLRVMFETGNDVTGTPWDLFRRLDAEFGFVCDMAATRENAKVDAYVGPDHEDPACRDCLRIAWPTSGPVWLNPPYSRAYPFIEKAAKERERGVTTVLLLASRTDTAWFHNFIWDADAEGCREGVEIRFLRRRLTFQGHTNPAPFPSMLIVMRGAPRA